MKESSTSYRTLIATAAGLLLIALAARSGCAGSAASVSDVVPYQKTTYKITSDTVLHLWFYEYIKPSPGIVRPAVVFFHGGGWQKGSPGQFSRQARSLAQQGMITASAEYRLVKSNDAVPLEPVLDARSVIRWLRANAGSYGVDPKRIAAAGGSAGGHLALSTMLMDDMNDPSDDLSISAHPDALVLFNPVVDPTKTAGKGMDRLSPLLRLDRPLPPTIIMHGTNDALVPYATVQDFVARARAAGTKDITLIMYDGRSHGFFNQSGPGDDDYAATLQETVLFFKRLAWIR